MGITGGIGSALARLLSSKNHLIYGFARSEDNLKNLKDELTGINVEKCDATNHNELKNVFKKANDEMGSIDAYVHAIGSILIKPAHLTANEQWINTLNINLNTAFYGLKESVNIMQKQNSGAVVFFSSTAAKIGIPNHEAIAASKAGIEALVRSAAATYSNRNIRFNSIAPGLTDTNLSRPITSSPQALEISKKMCPLNSIGDANDVASLASWLISDDAKFVTGESFTIDGGLSNTASKPRA